jgi:hypothetical protein
MEISFDSGMYGTGQSRMNLPAIAVEVAITAIVSGLAGAAFGWVYGSGKKEKGSA